MSKETFHTDYGILNRIHDDDPHFGTSGAMGFGSGGIGGIRQDIGHAIRFGFGRNIGNLIGRTTRRKFNRHFQRGNYTGHGYDYECGLPSSYYPSTHVQGWHPYSFHFDPYPYHDFQHNNRLNTNVDVTGVKIEENAHHTRLNVHKIHWNKLLVFLFVLFLFFKLMTRR